MRNIRIYQPGAYVPGDLVQLSPAAHQHVGVVLRMKPGDPLTLFAGNNQEFYGLISPTSTRKQTHVEIQTAKEVNRESPRIIHLGQAISKGERMEIVIQKAVELGVSSITPIVSKHCAIKFDEERKVKKHVQWQNIAISACEQSGRNSIPTIHPICSFSSYLQKTTAALRLTLNPYSKKSWRDCAFTGDIELLIGPEGGLAEEEILQAEEYNFQSISLGPRILRTETAAIAILSVLQAMSGDL
ncbi:16S rRNA methyltransferase (plasmid) [Legionella adelaidensis]|uniref:Ribosomal RNA small subunit methyltransferase E n=1 Tax=Legionella adelaidensis TaxID=45056 RepID=A0A0W0R2T6_9GAMM|nr:16S rRNA (uracil(1498)-N(3))-methyltransferase [Legionella adelaidensis]KTC65323.1 16S rRNA methyltransferase [Legionella adelaidensis]VEH86026.1 16S rRNA methyltransferase [Legionella adelaidensis]